VPVWMLLRIPWTQVSNSWQMIHTQYVHGEILGQHLKILWATRECASAGGCFALGDPTGCLRGAVALKNIASHSPWDRRRSAQGQGCHGRHYRRSLVNPGRSQLVSNPSLLEEFPASGDIFSPPDDAFDHIFDCWYAIHVCYGK